MKCAKILDYRNDFAADDRRREPHRVATMRVARIVGPTHQELCIVRNISPTGLQARVYRERQAGDVVDIEFKSGQIIRGTVAWTRNFIMGVRFHARADVDCLLSSRWAGEMMIAPPRSLRLDVDCPAILRIGARRHAVELRDLSQGGAKLALRDPVERGPAVLTVPGLPHLEGTIRWQRSELAGVAFNEPLALQVLANWVAERQSQNRRLRAISAPPVRESRVMQAWA